MNEEYVTYGQAVALKECGFDWPCNHYYTKENAADDEVWLTTSGVANWNADDAIPFGQTICSAPAQALVQKWLREVKGIAINVIAHDGGEYHFSEVFLPNFQERDYKWYKHHEHPLVPTYEEALSMGISHILKLFNSNENV